MAKLEVRKKRIGSLDVLSVEGEASAPTVVLFHGFGADMADLASLAGVIQAKKGTNWIFPNGHLKVPIAPHQEGRAWFPISLAELNRDSSDPLDWSAITPPGMKKARLSVMHMLQELNVPSDRLVLGGFSQGAMIATDVALHLETPPAGLALLSATLINQAEWLTLAQAVAEKLKAQGKTFSFFQSHGLRDQVLGLPMAEKLEKLFLTAGWKGRLLKFNGAHEIPSEALIQLSAYLRAI